MTLGQICEAIIEVCLNVRRGEAVLLVRGLQAPPEHHASLLRAAEERGAMHLVLDVPADIKGKAAASVAALFCNVDVVILGTPWIFPHSLRRQATAAGARLLSLCTLSDEMLLRAAAVDHVKLAAYTRRAAEAVGGAALWQIRTAAGTDLTASIGGRRVVVLDGMAREPGASSGLPAGVVAVTPVPQTASGRVVIDGSIDGYGLVRQPAVLAIERGAVVNISGGDEARFLRERLDAADVSARCLCEVGMGTNACATYTGNLVEDERVRGSAHVGFGGNIHLGGENPSPLHFDATMRLPSILLDGRFLVKDGQLAL